MQIKFRLPTGGNTQPLITAEVVRRNDRGYFVEQEFARSGHGKSHGFFVYEKRTIFVPNWAVWEVEGE